MSEEIGWEVSYSSPIVVIVCGDRHWTDEDTIIHELRKLPNGSTIKTGDAKGADYLAHSIAKIINKEFVVLDPYEAKWHMYGRGAGPKRNTQMLLEPHPELVLAFHNNITASRGTANMISQAVKEGVRVVLISNTTHNLLSICEREMNKPQQTLIPKKAQ